MGHNRPRRAERGLYSAGVSKLLLNSIDAAYLNAEKIDYVRLNGEVIYSNIVDPGIYQDQDIPVLISELVWPTDRWVKPVVRVAWFDGTNWRAVLPNGVEGDHMTVTLDVDPITTDYLVDGRKSVRPSVVSTPSGGSIVATFHEVDSYLNFFLPDDTPALVNVPV